MDGGALTTAVYYLMKELFHLEDMKPSELYEKICFGNYGKYAVEFDDNGEKCEKNQDYANDKNKLNESQEYIKADIDVLKPDYIIMIRTMINKGKQKEFLISIKGKAKIVPVMQFNPKTINRHIKNFNPDEFNNINASVKQWFEMIDEERTGKGLIKGKFKKYFHSLFSYLWKVLKKDIID